MLCHCCISADVCMCFHVDYQRISDVDTGTFKYFIKVVPTDYQKWTGVYAAS